MFTGKTYLFAKSAQEAYDTLQKHKSNTVIGGCCWLKMSKRRIGTVIDLSQAGLDKIEDFDEYIKIGAMVSLRQLETSSLILDLWDSVLSNCVKNIVGVQFRNSATVGGSVYMRAGFSDLLTVLLSLDTMVHLHNAGSIKIEDFLNMPYTRDIVTHITIKKDSRKVAYHTLRNQETDFPVMAVAVSLYENQWNISVGARPSKACRAYEAEKIMETGNIESTAQCVSDTINFQSNVRASKEYRKQIAKVLTQRAIIQVKNRGDK